MYEFTITRKVDRLGRTTISAEIRRDFDVHTDDEM